MSAKCEAVKPPNNHKELINHVLSEWAYRGSAADLRQIAGYLQKNPKDFASEIGLDPSLVDECEITPAEKIELTRDLRQVIKPFIFDQPDLSTEEGRQVALASGMLERAFNATTMKYDDLVWEHPIREAMKIFSHPGVSKVQRQESWVTIYHLISEYEQLVVEASRGMTEIAEHFGLKNTYDLYNIFLWPGPVGGMGYARAALYAIASDPEAISEFGLSQKEYTDLYNNPLKCANLLGRLQTPLLELNGKNITDLVNSLAPPDFPQCSSIEDLKKANIYVYPIDGQYPVSYVLFDKEGNYKLIALVPKTRAQRVFVAHELGHLFTFWQLIEKEKWKPEETFFIPYSYLEAVALVTQHSFSGITKDEERLNAVFFLVQRATASLFMGKLWEQRMADKDDGQIKQEMRRTMKPLGSGDRQELWALLATRTGFMTLYDFNYTFASIIMLNVFQAFNWKELSKDPRLRPLIYSLTFIKELFRPQEGNGIRGG